jgi:hypothetical protein
MCPRISESYQGRKKDLIAAEMDCVDDSNDTVEMSSFVFASEFADLDCYWSGEGAPGGFHYDASGTIFF